MRVGLPLLLVLLVLAAAAAGGDDATGVRATVERGRSLPRILDIVLRPDGGEVEGERTLWFLVDPTSSVGQMGLARALEAAMARAGASLGDTLVAVSSADAPDEPVATPSGNPKTVAAAVERALASPTDRIRNVYAAARNVSRALRHRGGARDLVLVTLENGDTEDDLEGTVQDLDRAGVRVFTLTREAYLADSWWYERAERAPPKTTFTGQDGAFVEFPWAILFQPARGYTPVASGNPRYGLARLVAATNGRAFLYTPTNALEHVCTPQGTCPFCTGDHAPVGRGFDPNRMRALAPIVSSRDDAFDAAAHDPFFRALLDAWESAAKAGLVGTYPPVRIRGGTLREDRPRSARLGFVGGSTSWRSMASRAERLAEDCTKLLERYEADLEAARERGGMPRYEGFADAFRVLLHVTRVNCLYLAAYCREVGPTLVEAQPEEFPPPELPPVGEDQRITGVGHTVLGLCHGVAPFQRLHLPGGEAMRAELRRLQEVVDPFLQRWGGTPFADLLYRAGIARFHLTVRGRYVPPPPRQPTASTSDSTSTPTDRPTRTPAPAGTGSGTGPVTGGDR